MGEYFTNRQGKSLAKAGTCDNWRYVRREECLKWMPHDGGKGTNVEEVIKNCTTLYRFPFPDEDDAKSSLQVLNFDAINHRDMFRTYSFKSQLSGIPHQERCVSVSVVDRTSPHINIFIKCPADTDLPYRTSLDGATPYIGIVGERYINEKPYTIFRCCWCDNWFTVDESEIESLRQGIIAMRPDSIWNQKIAERCHAKH